MFSKEEIVKLQQKIDDLSDSLKLISERQNSQYTDIGMHLNKIEDAINSANENMPAGLSNDELYSLARTVVIAAGKASTSYIQRKLCIGYSSAANLMDTLQERGVIGPANGSKPREILITDANIRPITDDLDSEDRYEEAREAVVSSGKASTAYIQRKLGIGYSHAAKLMDMLEDNEIIGPADGSKPRDVISS
ncbi:MAG: DNA translocase FtsK [Candidatus Taylorbacteria bacterium]